MHLKVFLLAHHRYNLVYKQSLCILLCILFCTLHMIIDSTMVLNKVRTGPNHPIKITEKYMYLNIHY